MKTKRAIATRSEVQPTSDQRSFIHRRTEVFLDSHSMTLPLKHLMAEAYFQGMRDTFEVMSTMPPPFPILSPEPRK